MSEGIVAKGKNSQEAIENGLEKMGLSESQVEIEIVQNETAGFLGLIGTKPAIVRIIAKKESGADRDLKNISSLSSSNGLTGDTERSFGQVWVTDGQLFFKETAAHFPTITPPKEVSFYKNGKLIRKTTALMEKDEIEVKLPSEDKEPVWSIVFDSLKITASLTLEPGYRRRYRLIDQEPRQHLTLELAVDEEVINPLRLPEIEKRMKELGIQTGIDRDEIQKALEAREPGVFIIARGINPERGKDGRIKCLFKTEWKNHIPKLVENGDIDDRTLVTIPSIYKGQLLGIIYPPLPGKPGLAVTGEEVPPVESKSILVLTGRGVDSIDEGKKLVAVATGRPFIETEGHVTKVSVIPRLRHSTDVDVTSGSLSYFGDIEILGDCKEKMTVEAMADLLIHGSVQQSKITAENNVIICKNVLNSNVIAGRRNLMMVELAKLMRRLIKDLHGFKGAVEQIYLSPVFKTSDIAKMGLSSLIRILLEKKFKALPVLINEISELVTIADQMQILDPEYREIQADLVCGFIKLVPTQFRKPDDIAELLHRVEEVLETSTVSPESNAHIMIPYTMNSELYCSGDITIVGKGCIDSTIQAQGKVLIQGVLRGGNVFAAKGAIVNETGSKGGKLTAIEVPVTEMIQIQHALEGTIIKIGNHIHQFAHPTQNVCARVTNEGRLLLF
ncbi:FapA family protein [Neobacillus jeddahensis]|uniref:FapA family protein n=1 Tax=Neobacillus jeddahensis TaxID=1461580 RepID=UPI00058B7962|nr:FapA family protein [Neobacillus jeddahensis]